MDNVDGKQARRTGQSSGLGELFEYVWTMQAAVSVMLNVGQSRHRLAKLYTGKPVRNGCFGIGLESERGLHRADTLFAYVLLYLGDLSHSHAVLGLFQWPDWYGYPSMSLYLSY